MLQGKYNKKTCTQSNISDSEFRNLYLKNNVLQLVWSDRLQFKKCKIL